MSPAHEPRRVLIVMSCLHTAMFRSPAPRVGERAYCMKCGAYRDALEAPHDYAVACRSCQYHRELGNAEIKAETVASRHSLRRPGHLVILTDGERVVREYRHDALPRNTERPPF